MYRASLKSVLARKRRLALTVIAVMLGVSFVTGTLVLTDTSNRLFDDQFAARPDGADLVVRVAAEFDQGMGVAVERDPVTPETLDRLRAVDGVGQASPSVYGQALLVTGDDPIVPAGGSIGASWQPAPFNDFTLRAGREPTRDREVVIDAATAQATGLGVGDEVGVQSDGPAEPFTIVGIAGYGEHDGPPNASAALFDLTTAQQRLAVTEGFTQVGIIAAEGTTVSELRDRIADTLGDRFEVADKQDIAAASAEAAREQLGMLRMLLYVIAVTGLVVGAFLIANTFTVLIAQRTAEFATLRAVGATGRQVLASVLAEAVAVGAAASAAGAGLGIAAAAGLRRLAGAFGTDLPDGPLVVAPRTLVVGLAIGVAVTVLAAAGSARRAARVSPVEAMRGAAGPPRTLSRARLAAGLCALLATVGLGIFVATGEAQGLAPVGLVAVLGLATVTVLGPLAARPAVLVVGAPFSRLGMSGRLARDGAARAPRRTAATVSALAVGLAVVTFMTVLAASTKASINATTDEVIVADYLIESVRGEMLGGLSHHVAHEVGDLEEVAVAARMQFGHWKDGTRIDALSAIDPATFTQVAEIDMVDGSLGALADGGIVVSQPVARSRGLEVGDTLTMTFARTGEQQLEVVGILDGADQWALRTGYVMSLDTYATNFTEDLDAAVLVKVSDGVGADAAHAAISTTLEGFPTAALRDQAAARAAQTATVDQILGLVTVLLLLAVGIALLGITNTLALAVVERTRELGLLRAVGMTRRQVGSMVRAEALLVAVLGAVVGLSVGLGLAAVALPALANQGPMPFTVPVAQLSGYLGVAAVAGLLAGLVPARRASRLDVLAAIAS